MEVIEIKNSSAIAKVSFDVEQHIVGIAFTYNADKDYLYKCDTIEDVKSYIIETEETGGSVGKLINQYKKDATFETINI